MKELLEQFKALTLEKRALQAQVAEIQAKLDDMDAPLKQAAEEAGLSSFALASGGKVIFTSKVSAKIVDKDALLAGVKAEGLESILTVHSASLTALANERMEQGLAELPGVEVTPYTTVSFRA